ncbi:Receptor-like protein EIX2 [Linum perenne]
MQSFRTNLSLTILLLFSFLSLPLGDSRCTKTDIEALLTFKNGLVDPSGRLSSWKGDDCCKWVGVKCSNGSTVTELSLRNPYPSMNAGNIDQEAYKASCLKGNISSSLLQLPNLSYFDMSLNDFEGGKIPEFLGGMKSLRYLNLSYSLFGGEIPSQLGSLSNLQVLDLNGPVELRATNLGWLSALSMLKHLNLGSVRIVNSGGDWLTAVNMLPSLVELHLHYCQLQVLPQSLPVINFTSLSVLDLSDNSFNSPIPPWLFKLTSLRELYLRWDFLSGPVPSELSLLKSLEVLDLSNNLEFGGQVSGVFGSLTKLKRLDLSANNLKGEIPDTLGVLQKLQTLDLSRNGFRGSIPNSIGKMSSLKQLDLSFNSMDGSIPESFGQLSELVGCSTVSLEMLDLNSNNLVGEIPDSIGLLKNMKHLDMAYNSLWGSIPATIGNLSALEVLYLHSNQMNGSIPESFGKLSKLRDLNLIANSWQGIITEVHLMNLTSLESFMLSTWASKSLVFKVDPLWVPPFRLDYIQVEGCTVGPHFSTWLQVQNRLTQVKLQNVGISDTIPEEWFSQLSSNLIILDLSDNQIRGKLPVKLHAPKLDNVDLASNRFEGPVPRWSTNATQFYLHENLFSGPLPRDIGTLMPRLRNLHLSENNLNGTIPSSICKMTDLQVLSLRNNHLSGELLDCWEELSALWVVDVSNNDLSGKIPTSMGLLGMLGMLLLSENNLVGEIPSSLQNLSALTSIDLGENQLSGEIPRWIGEKLSATFILRLRSNKFHGQVPEALCNLQLLHFLDLSNNNLSGKIPKCLHNMTAMVYGNSSELYYRDFQFRMAYFKEETTVVTKGRAYDYHRNIALLNVIDLSENNLTGLIPDEMTKLQAVRVLNLSNNHIIGEIPKKIGDLKVLETFDLSHNQLSGEIPTSLSSLTFLTNLVLSYNNFSGKIPTGSQLQTFEASSYEGNRFLCGFPSPVNCTMDRTTKTTTPSAAEPEDETDKDEIFELSTGLYVSIALGFVIGFLGLCVTLLRKEFRKTEDSEW